MISARCAFLVLSLACTGLSQAVAGPLGLPVQTPPPVAPVVNQVTDTVRSTTEKVGDTVDGATDRIKDLKLLHVDAAGRPNDPRAFEKDDKGARVVRGVVLAIALSDAGRNAAAALNIDIGASESLGSLGITVTKLNLPEGMAAASAVAALRAADPAGTYDFDHVYDPTGGATLAEVATPLANATAKVSRIGMIDAGIELDHPALRDVEIDSKNTVVGARGDHPSAHGTAVASLLVGEDRDFHGALSGVTLYAADAFCGAANGGAADDIARALAWLVDKNVPVINVSIAGPENALLEAAVKATLARGHVIVAAVGNDGPAVGVRYPAAYDGVIAVTSVDGNHRVQVDANRGPQVTFAARGVSVRAATLDGGYGTMTGTSFASPIVAARFAQLLPRADKALADAARAQLIAAVRAAADKASPNLAYGYGIVEPAHP
ncbi:MAG: S8 family serine peptidase [Alphaproteobacteria bacterium]|nr:S8 family serine peptidase [Alphaproteobacteria bacterium]